MQGPAIRASARTRRFRTVAVSVTLAAALASACASISSAPVTESTGVHIDTNSPIGLRAKQTIDMLNSDWPIGPIGVRTLAAPDMVEPVGVTMDRMWWDRPFTVSAVEVRAGAATLHLVTAFGGKQDVELHVDEKGMVDRFDVELRRPEIKTFGDVDAELTKSAARYSYQVAKVDKTGPVGRCDPVAGTNTSESLPLASIFKLYVLYAVATGVKAGRVSWDDMLTITEGAKAVGSSGFDELPAGAQVSVRTAAEKMIATSDNMATDLLIARLGPGAVERALADAGHHDPGSMTPFPTMHELFSVGWGKPDLRSQWRDGSPQARLQLLAQTRTRPYEPDPERTHTPASNYGAEWYGSAQDVCRVHAALQAIAVGPTAPVRQILSAIPGIDLDNRSWPYVGAKAGNLPGDLTFSWYAEDSYGQGWVVSFQLNWPRYYGPGAGAWLLSIAKQVFATLPQER